jgi:hypothetical protein
MKLTKQLFAILTLPWLSATTAMATDTACQATYSPNTGKLLIPCVAVSDSSGDTVSHTVVLQQLSETVPWQFILEQFSTNPAPQAISACQATYVVTTGQLLLPCVSVATTTGQLQSYQARLEQDSSESWVFTMTEVNENHLSRPTRGIISLVISKTDLQKLQTIVDRITNKAFSATEITKLTNLLLDQVTVADLNEAKNFQSYIDPNKTPVVLTKPQKGFIDKILTRTLAANNKNVTNKTLVTKAINEIAKMVKAGKLVVK